MKRRILPTAFAVVAVALMSSVSHAVVIFDVDFEPPVYALGPAHGQDGWSAQFGPVNHINNTLVHGGTQSFQAIAGSRTYDGGATLPIGGPSTFYLETWACIPPFAVHQGVYEALFGSGNVNGAAFYIAMRGDGLLSLHTGNAFTQRTLGANGLDKWLRFRIEKLVAGSLHLSVVGPGVNETFTGSNLTSFLPTHLFVGTNSTSFPGGTATPYFDDIKAAVDELPVSVEAASWGAIKRLFR